MSRYYKIPNRKMKTKPLRFNGTRNNRNCNDIYCLTYEQCVTNYLEQGVWDDSIYDDDMLLSDLAQEYCSPIQENGGVCLGPTSGYVRGVGTGIAGNIAQAFGHMISHTPYYNDGENINYCYSDGDCPCDPVWLCEDVPSISGYSCVEAVDMVGCDYWLDWNPGQIQLGELCPVTCGWC